MLLCVGNVEKNDRNIDIDIKGDWKEDVLTGTTATLDVQRGRGLFDPQLGDLQPPSKKNSDNNKKHEEEEIMPAHFSHFSQAR